MDDAASHATEPPDNLSETPSSQDDVMSPTQRSNPFTRRMQNDEEHIDIHRPTCSILFSTFEQALAMAGGFGRYHVIFLILLQATTTEFAGNYMLLTLSVYEPQVACTYTAHDGINQTMQLNATTRDEFCAIYESNNCSAVTWSSKFQGTRFKTIIEEWALICSLDHVPEMINSATLFGPLIVTFIISALSDFFGRKKIFLANMTIMFGANVLCALVQHWQTYMAARLVSMAAVYACITTQFLWTMEITPKSHHSISNFAGMWHFAYVFAGSLAYVTDGWRQYMVALDILAIPIISWSLGFAESPSLLIQNGKLDEASASLTTIARFNRRKEAPKFTPLNLNSINQQRARGRNRLGSFDSADFDPGQSKLRQALQDMLAIVRFLFHKRTAYYVWLLCCIIIGVSACCNGYLFQMSKIQLDPHLMVIIYGAVRLCLMPPVIWLDYKLMTFGRRDMACISLLLATIFLGTALTCQIIWPEASANRTDVWRDWALMLTAAVVCNLIYVVVGQYIVELFPTVQRNRIAAITSSVDSLTAIVVPQVVYLENYWPNVLLIFCTAATGVSYLLAVTLLPETKGKPLPDNFSEEELMLQFVNDELVQCKFWCSHQGNNGSELLQNMEQNERTVDA